VEKARDTIARLIIRRRGRAAEPVYALVNVGACLNLEPAQRTKYDLRHLRGRSVVEVVQARVRETRKFAFDCSDIEALIRSARLHLRLPLPVKLPTNFRNESALRRSGRASFVVCLGPHARPFADQMTRLDVGGLDQDQSCTGCGEA